jgi:hypothetical protein
MIFFPELLDSAGAVDKLLFAREKGMTVRANFDADFFLCGTRFKRVAAGANHSAFIIARMNIFLHNSELLFILGQFIISNSQDFRQISMAAHIYRKSLSSRED